MFSEAFYSYFNQLFEERKEDEVFDENHFFYMLKARFPETCQKYDGLQSLFFDIIREKWPVVFKFFGFTLRKCASCKLNHIVDSRTNNFFISGGGEWVYESSYVDSEEDEGYHTFACYTYGSRFDYESVDVSEDDFRAGNLFYDNFLSIKNKEDRESMEKEEAFFCDKCLFQHNKEGKINFDSEFSETVYEEMRKGTDLIRKYDFEQYEALTSDINKGHSLSLYY